MSFAIRDFVKAAPLDEQATSEMVRMRDEVRLATDVYLPNRPTRHPTVFWRTPYDKCSRYTELKYIGKHFAERGYVFVAQDCRGKFRSEGETIPYQYDVMDSYDTVDWIVSQPWSDGNVGLLGPSYAGYTVWAGVASAHPAIKVAIPQVTGVEMADVFVGSRWRQVVPNLWGADDLIQMWSDPNIYFVSIDYGMRPVVDAFQEAFDGIGVSCAAMSRLLQNARTEDIANPYGSRHPYYTTNIPIQHWIHWFDPVLGGPLGLADYHFFRALPGARDLHFFWANSASHEGFLLENVPKRPENDFNTNDSALETRIGFEVNNQAAFFDPFLRGIGTPPTPSSRARWHLAHVGWQESPEWPPPQTRRARYYFVTGENNGDGALSLKPDSRCVPVRWIHDPAAPVQSSTTHDQVWTFLEDYPDERDYASLPDVLTFTSEVVVQPTDIAGRIDVFVAVGSSAPSMHIFVKLLDVDPDGGVYPISRGQIVVRSPDPEQLVQIDLIETAYRVRPGHRLRVQVASSDYPLWLVHPGTDDNPWFASSMVTNEQLLMTGGVSASYLELRVLADGVTSPEDV